MSSGEEKSLPVSEETYGNIKITAFDALKWVTSSYERTRWINEDYPFFDVDTWKLWKLIYQNEGVFYPGSLGRGEKTLFIEYPYYIAKDDGRFVGGMGLKGKKTIKVADGEADLSSFYILVNPDDRRRGTGSALLRHMESDIKGDGFYTEWGPRKDLEFSEFMEKHGYSVVHEPLISRAIKMR